MLFAIVNDPVLSANELNQDLKVIHQWAYQWKMEFNPDPNKQSPDYYFPARKIVEIIHHFSSMVL